MKTLLMTCVFLSLSGFVFFDTAQADWGPDLWLSSATMEFDGEASLFVRPDGQGKAFDEAYAWGGIAVDATITLELIGFSGDPIENFPWEDIWIASGDDGLIICNLGACPEDNTDANGHTSWTMPLRGGGHSEENCWVLVNGAAIGGPGIPLHFNSADISGDLIVNLTDIALFAEDFFGDYDYRCDFYYDGELNLSDLSLLAQSILASCP